MFVSTILPNKCELHVFRRTQFTPHCSLRCCSIFTNTTNGHSTEFRTFLLCLIHTDVASFAILPSTVPTTHFVWNVIHYSYLVACAMDVCVYWVLRLQHIATNHASTLRHYYPIIYMIIIIIMICIHSSCEISSPEFRIYNFINLLCIC